jgi:hypothetical protein
VTGVLRATRAEYGPAAIAGAGAFTESSSFAPARKTTPVHSSAIIHPAQPGIVSI